MTSAGLREEIASWAGESPVYALEEAEKIANLKRLTLGLCGTFSSKSRLEMYSALAQSGLSIKFGGVPELLEGMLGKEFYYGTNLMGDKERFLKITKDNGRYEVERLERYVDE